MTWNNIDGELWHRGWHFHLFNSVLYSTFYKQVVSRCFRLISVKCRQLLSLKLIIFDGDFPFFRFISWRWPEAVFQQHSIYYKGTTAKLNVSDYEVFKRATKLLRYAVSQRIFQADQRPAFCKNVRKTKTFTDMASQLQERLAECTSLKSKREKHILKFLLLKCQRMKFLEAEGHK